LERGLGNGFRGKTFISPDEFIKNLAGTMNYAAKIMKDGDEYIVSFPDKPSINTCGERGF